MDTRVLSPRKHISSAVQSKVSNARTKRRQALRRGSSSVVSIRFQVDFTKPTLKSQQPVLASEMNDLQGLSPDFKDISKKLVQQMNKAVSLFNSGKCEGKISYSKLYIDF